MLNSVLLILLLIIISAFFSMAEISLAASRKIKLKVLADGGNSNALRVLKLQETPGAFFTVIQIGLNTVAILGGIIGDAIFSPSLQPVFASLVSVERAEQIASFCSFVLVTGMFILFADLIPKRIGMIAPESVAVRLVNPMLFCLLIFRPLVWLFNGVANLIFVLFNFENKKNDDITYDDIYAVVEAGALAGVLHRREHELIENVFELESRTVPSAMTSRESVIYFDLQESEESIKEKISIHPHSKFLVCDGSIDKVIGYVDSKDLLNCVLSNRNLVLSSGLEIHAALIIPDTLTLSEALESFKTSGEDFAVILNEYALVVGIITLSDVMITLMGDFVGQGQEEQIIARDENSWLMEGGTPVDNVMHLLDIKEFPQDSTYETIGGFMMYMLRKIPKRTDYVNYAGYKFEVVDIDSHKIDQLLVTRLTDQHSQGTQKSSDLDDINR